MAAIPPGAYFFDGKKVSKKPLGQRCLKPPVLRWHSIILFSTHTAEGLAVHTPRGLNCMQNKFSALIYL